MKQSMQVLVSSEHNSWYTPSYIIEMAREVMGSIGLDPASHAIPQAWIKAEEYYTERLDGLSRPWYGKCWLNSPYGKTGSRSNQQIWSDRLLEAIRRGYVPEAIMLTKAVPGYKWWDELFNGKWPGPVCITRDRISFVRADGTTRGKSKAASSFWYYGPNGDKFNEVFSTIGRVIYRSEK